MLTTNYQRLKDNFLRRNETKYKFKNEEHSSYPKIFSASSWIDYKDWLKEQKTKDVIIESKKKKNKRKPKSKTVNFSREYKEQLKHPFWFKKRKEILKRDDYKCRLCGSKQNLQVHHIKYINDKMAWEYKNKYLITLCDVCHNKVHSESTNELNPHYKNFRKNIIKY